MKRYHGHRALDCQMLFDSVMLKAELGKKEKTAFNTFRQKYKIPFDYL